jgi:hypothetical protein
MGLWTSYGISDGQMWRRELLALYNLQ